jgi:hypothetical protein
MPGGYPAGYAAPPQGGGGKGLVVVLAIVAVLVLGGAGFGVWYFLSGGGKSVAHEHLPSGCDVVARFDFAGVLKAGPIAKHVVPVLEEAAAESKDAGKGAKFFLSAKLNPKKDIKEMAMCMNGLERAAGRGIPGASPPEFVIIVGGNLTKDKVLDAIITHGKKEKISEAKKDGGLRYVEVKETPPAFIAQADDGALLIASSLDMLKKANNTGNHKDYKLPLDNHLEVVVTEAAVKRLSGLAGAGSPVSLSKAGRLQVTASLDPGKLGGRFNLGESASDAATKLNELLSKAKGSPGIPPQAKPTVDGLTIKADGNELVIEAPISSDAVDELAKAFAEGFKKAQTKAVD